MTTILQKFQSMEYGPAPEDPKETLAWLDAHARTFGHFINGRFTKSTHTVPTINPATGETLAQISQGTQPDIDAAVAAARAALPAWQALTGHQRARFLYAFARQVQKHSRRLAVLETLDNGKPIRESRDIDIPLVARHFYHHAGWAQLLETEFPNQTAVGVVAQIIPWNFPALMFAWKVAPALAAGCTVVLKPAEFTPLTALAMAEIAQEIALPPGVLNIVTGDGSTGAALVAHPGTDKIAFTGSTEVGRIIRKATANTPKKLSLELGGKSPFLVFDDADLDSAVEGLVDGIWFNQGQVCCAGSRLLVQERVADKLFDKLRARMATLRVGSPLDKAIDIGAIVDQVQLDRIHSLVTQGIDEGCTCWQPDIPLPAQGLFYPPTLLTNVHPASTVAQQEIFGPVLAAMTFRTPAEAVELANNTTYGLAASIWSESINVALDVAAQIKAGVIWINSTNLFDASCGFGGYRESGYGREGGREGMAEYLTPTWLHREELGHEELIAETISEPKSTSGSASVHPKTTPNQSNLHGQTTSAAPNSPTANGLPSANHSTTSSDARSTLQTSSRGPSSIDRTVKQYIGGKQTRPDSGYTFPVHALDGTLVGEAPLGNRKDIRNAVEAARAAAPKWAKTTAHNRAQVLFYLAENMAARQPDLIAALTPFTGPGQAAMEVEASIERTFTYAGWADKFEGSMHNPPMRMVTLAMLEPIGTIGLLAPDDTPLLSLLSLVLPAIAMGNTVVAVPSQTAATLMADLYQLFDTSDLPAGVINLVAGPPLELGKTLAEHDDIDAIWSFRDRDAAQASAMVKLASIGNLKQVWTNEGLPIAWADAWFDPAKSSGRHLLRHATQVKNIWLPYGE